MLELKPLKEEDLTFFASRKQTRVALMAIANVNWDFMYSDVATNDRIKEQLIILYFMKNLLPKNIRTSNLNQFFRRWSFPNA